MQVLFLSDAHLAAKVQYLIDVIDAIRHHDQRLLSTVIAYELENEACFELDAPPFSRPDTLTGRDEVWGPYQEPGNP